MQWCFRKAIAKKGRVTANELNISNNTLVGEENYDIVLQQIFDLRSNEEKENFNGRNLKDSVMILMPPRAQMTCTQSEVAYNHYVLHFEI